MEDALKLIQFQLPAMGMAATLDQDAQGPIQPSLEHLQGWGIHSFSGQIVPVPHHPLS